MVCPPRPLSPPHSISDCLQESMHGCLQIPKMCPKLVQDGFKMGPKHNRFFHDFLMFFNLLFSLFCFTAWVLPKPGPNHRQPTQRENEHTCMGTQIESANWAEYANIQICKNSKELTCKHRGRIPKVRGWRCIAVGVFDIYIAIYVEWV